ncbi:Ferrous iron transport protein A [Planctomycetes bacterium Pla163]|uniref:Ferrous iron transport protein A n=1 Tax=Rohdeia mirabilis TaxID=2528008 RepID=A0A518D0N5_9BACT|nr:Ferrous iron transport protein A [Planctomycetes bacterium Pla163]
MESSSEIPSPTASTPAPVTAAGSVAAPVAVSNASSAGAPATVPVSELVSGASGRLVGIGGARAFRRRLMELGLVPGTLVRVVRRAPMGGIVELEVRRCRISLRLVEARDLTVEPA